MRKLLIPILSIGFSCLTGCAILGASSGLGPDAIVPDDSTLFSGKQPGETKRHADDWVGPLVDGAVVLAIAEANATADAAPDGPPAPPSLRREHQTYHFYNVRPRPKTIE
jgi:hypothetical protein